MPGYIHPLEEVQRATATGAASEDVTTTAVPAGWTWLVDHYSFEDETTALTAIRVFKTVGGHHAGIEEVLGPVAGVLYDGDKPILLTEGQRLGASFVGATASDGIVLNVFGVKLPPGADPEAPDATELVRARHPLGRQLVG